MVGGRKAGLYLDCFSFRASAEALPLSFGKSKLLPVVIGSTVEKTTLYPFNSILIWPKYLLARFVGLPFVIASYREIPELCLSVLDFSTFLLFFWFNS